MAHRLFTIVVILFCCNGCSRGPQCARSPIACATDTMINNQNESAFISQRGGRDITAEFRQRFCATQTATEASNAPALEGCDLLLVHGWLGEVAIRLTGLLDSVNCNQRILDYLKDQHAAADEMGLPASAPPFRSEGVCACGEKVARMIACSPRPVILLSHSKGCLDTLEALLILQREGQLHKVAGWIAVQGPFYGAAGAETFMRSKNPFGRLRIRMLGANPVGVRDMIPICRENYMAQHSAEIETLIQAIPVVCFASWKTPLCDGDPLTDGHVVPESAILPGSEYIAVAGISHSMPVINRNAEPFDRVTFTKTLLAMLRERSHSTPSKQ